MSDPYDMIDRFLRNNLHDDDYAEYSEALDSLCRAQPAQAVPLLSDDEIDAIQRQTNAAYYAGTLKDRDHSHAIERLVRSKCGIVGKEGA